MNLINFMGLNCYYSCIASVAGELGVDYTLSFAKLWSETDFKYDRDRRVFLSKRMLTELDALGAKLTMLDCASPLDAGESLSSISNGEYFVVGMDAYAIPWNQLYGIHHGPHYFIAQKSQSQTLLCHDPTYNKKNQEISCRDLLTGAFDISRILRTEQNSPPPPPQACVLQQACEILSSHPSLLEKLLTQIRECEGTNREQAILSAGYVDALISNRCLYQHYLNASPSGGCGSPLFSAEHILGWKAVKNGLYKAALSSLNQDVIRDVTGLLRQLIESEIRSASSLLY